MALVLNFSERADRLYVGIASGLYIDHARNYRAIYVGQSISFRPDETKPSPISLTPSRLPDHTPRIRLHLSRSSIHES